MRSLENNAPIIKFSEDANNVRLDVKRCCGGREMGEIRIICEGSRNDVSGVRRSTDCQAIYKCHRLAQYDQGLLQD
jgi:hypothetical protein